MKKILKILVILLAVMDIGVCNGQFKLDSEGLTKDGLRLGFIEYPREWITAKLWAQRKGNIISIKFAENKPEGFSSLTCVRKIGDNKVLYITIPYSEMNRQIFEVQIEGDRLGRWKIEKNTR